MKLSQTLAANLNRNVLLLKLVKIKLLKPITNSSTDDWEREKGAQGKQNLHLESMVEMECG